MVSRLDRNRLYGEREALCDEVAEECRLANITGKQAQQLMDLVHKKHDECIEALRDYPDAEIDDVISAYRGLIRKTLKKS